MSEHTDEDLMAVLIAPRDWVIYDAAVAVFDLRPAQESYELPQFTDGADELTHDVLQARLRASPEERYDVYLHAPTASGVVIGVRPDGLLFGLPWPIGVERIEAFAAEQGITDGYLWGDAPLPETVAEAHKRQRWTQLGRLEAGRLVLGPGYELSD